MYTLPNRTNDRIDWISGYGGDCRRSSCWCAYQNRPLEILVREQEIIDSINLEQALGAQFKVRDLTTGGPSQHWRRILLGVTSQFFQQIGGCNAVIYYLPILFTSSSGQTQQESLLLGGINMIVYAVFSLLSFFTVERVGRRKLYLIGSGGQCLAMVITFACLIPKSKSAANGAAFGLFLYIAVFGATYLTVPWLWAAEINPLRIRAKELPWPIS